MVTIMLCWTALLFHTYYLEKSFLMQTRRHTLEHTQVYTDSYVSLDLTNSGKRKGASFYKTFFEVHEGGLKRSWRKNFQHYLGCNLALTEKGWSRSIYGGLCTQARQTGHLPDTMMLDESTHKSSVEPVHALSTTLQHQATACWGRVGCYGFIVYQEWWQSKDHEGKKGENMMSYQDVTHTTDDLYHDL